MMRKKKGERNEDEKEREREMKWMRNGRVIKDESCVFVH